MVEKDGGLWALGGYLYQIVGTLGINARVQNLQNQDTPDELDVLFDLFDVKKILPEQYGEDLLICGLESADGATLVQFKYSRKIVPTPLGKLEIEKIITTFKNNVKRASNDGVNVKLCVLITNRNFSPNGNEIWKAERQKIKEYILDCIPNQALEKFQEIIKTCAREYGAFDNEIEDGLDALIGKTLRISAGNYSADEFQTTLRKCFTGSQNAQKITLGHLSNICVNQLNEFGEDQLGLNHWDLSPIQRETYLQDIRKYISTRACIAICGPGGTGKSVLLWHLFHLNRQDSIYKIELASDITSRWIEKTVNQNWRKIPENISLNDNKDLAIERLVLANEGKGRQQPILWLGLDGIDEGITDTDQRGYIQELIKTFWELDKKCQMHQTLPNATLIITCRKENDIVSLLSTQQDLYNNNSKKIPVIEIDKFQNHELVAGVRQKFPHRFIEYNNFSSDNSDFLENSIFSSQPQLPRYSINVDETVYEILKNPIAWRAILMLEKNVQENILDGKKEAMNDLAKGILEWFQSKARHRKKNTLAEENLTLLLSQVAKETNTEDIFLQREWVTKIISISGATNIANDLYREAQSSGIIDGVQANSWRWRHSFIYDYLVDYHE